MKQEKKRIGNYEYIVTQVCASVGLEATARFANLLGPGFAAAPVEGGFNAQGFGAVLGGIFSNPALYPQLAWFVEAFGKNTQVILGPNQSKTLSDVYETHFAGEIENQLAWLAFAFEVNMGSFFERARGLWEKLQALKKASTALTFPPSAETTGQSGASRQAVPSTTP